MRRHEIADERGDRIKDFLPGQSTPARAFVRRGSKSYSHAPTENNPNRHGTSRNTVASVRPRVVSKPK